MLPTTLNICHVLSYAVAAALLFVMHQARLAVFQEALSELVMYKSKIDVAVLQVGWLLVKQVWVRPCYLTVHSHHL